MKPVESQVEAGLLVSRTRPVTEGNRLQPELIRQLFRRDVPALADFVVALNLGDVYFFPSEVEVGFFVELRANPLGHLNHDALECVLEVLVQLLAKGG